MNIAPLGESIAIDLITGIVIRAKTGGDKTKEASRATEIKSILLGMQKLNGGDVAGGLTAIQSALINITTLDPAEALAFHNFVSFASTRAALLQQIESETLAGQAISKLIDNALVEALSVCEKYIPAAPAQTA